MAGLVGSVGSWGTFRADRGAFILFSLVVVSSLSGLILWVFLD
jgi:hypothetical protein